MNRKTFGIIYPIVTLQELELPYLLPCFFRWWDLNPFRMRLPTASIVLFWVVPSQAAELGIPPASPPQHFSSELEGCSTYMCNFSVKGTSSKWCTQSILYNSIYPSKPERVQP